MVQAQSPNTLYYGDNLAIMREHIPDESVDLIYLDPPFNSNASYNVLFKAPEGHQSKAQIEAFDDTWHWTEAAELAFDRVMESGNSQVSEMLRAMLVFLGRNDMMAYLTMMAVRLLELHRVLKPTGSLYLHCDPTASHYLKILLDAVFGKKNYVNEIIWKRTNARGTDQRWPKLNDTIFLYSKSDNYFFKPTRVKAEKEKLPHTLITGPDGQKYQTFELTGAGQTKKGDSGKTWRGFDPNKFGRHWANSAQQREEWNASGQIHWPKNDGFPRRKAEKPFNPENREIIVGTVWTDIDRINQSAKERLGYPTQKPVALLERILAASSNPGDVVLDPFCGCGTTLHAAARMDRKWIGIDITHLAIALIRRRLNEAFPEMEFNTIGVPKDSDGARALALADTYEFQKWALSMIDAQPYKGGKKGGDGGVDGYLYFKPDGKKTEKAIVSVKGGHSLNPAMVKDLIVTVDQEGAKMGIFLTLETPTKGMITQAAAAGIYKTEYSQFPKIQIITVERLFQPASPLQMPWQDTSVFKKSQREPAHQPKLEL